MKNKSFAWLAARAGQMCIVALVVLTSATGAQAGEKVIYSFTANLVYNPNSGLISDSAGNLYGTTGTGGTANWGTVFELSPSSGGVWTETLLYSFQSFETGIEPYGTMTIDQDGNLYGTAETNDFNDTGVIFELVKGTNGAWSEKIIHIFGYAEGGPLGNLTWDGAGNLYGATSAPYTTFSGEIFELTPEPNGNWKETVLSTFPTANGLGGPSGGPIFDSKGNLYGALYYGLGGYGGRSGGAVYELAPQSGGPWKLILLYNFPTGLSARYPDSRLTFDASGNLYGTTQGPNYGAVFQLSPNPGGAWTETTIHTFAAGKDGANPVGATLVFDASGNLYGTTPTGGVGCNHNLCGVVYKLTPQSVGTWTETIVHPFESASDGSEPVAGVLVDSVGDLYGTTYRGGSRYGYGTVYEITP